MEGRPVGHPSLSLMGGATRKRGNVRSVRELRQTIAQLTERGSVTSDDDSLS